MRASFRRFGLVCVLFSLGCEPYQPALIEPGSGGDGAGEGGGGTTSDAGPKPDGSAGTGGSCMQGMDGCNLVDDDCDGEVDEDAVVACESVILNGVAECVKSQGVGRCILRECSTGFSNCDGNPTNGCEPYCACHECLDDGGVDPGEDAGEEDVNR